MEEINGYQLCSTELASTSGCTFWKAKKGDTFYFLKKFTDPKFPRNPDMETERQKHATEWYEEKKRVSERLLEINGQGNGNVICPLEYFVKGKSIYVVSYWEDRKTLMPQQIAQLSEEDKIFVLLILSAVLESVHEKNIVHADLKPDNILIVKNEKSGKYIAKVLDYDESFFSSQPLDDFKSEPFYRSPEVLLYKQKKDNDSKAMITCASDVFTMGIIFHEYWTGRTPYFHEDEEFEAVSAAVLRKKTITFDADMPLWLQTLIGKMISMDYKKRPTMKEVHTILLDVKNGKYEEVEKRLGIKKEDIPVDTVVTDKKTDVENTSTVPGIIDTTEIEKGVVPKAVEEKPESKDNKEKRLFYYQKCNEVVNHAPYNLNAYDKEMVEKWKKIRREFNLHGSEISDAEVMKNCYEELEKTLRNLLELKIGTPTSGYQGRYVACEKLPDGYSEVRIKDDNKIIVTVSGGGKLIVNKDYALAHKLIELR